MIKLLLNGKVFWLGSGAFLLDDAANEFRMLTTFYFSGAIRLGFRHGEWAVIKQLELLEDDGSLFERRAPRWLAQLALYPVLCARAFHAQSILCHDNIYTHFDNFALEIHAHWKLLLAHAHYLFKHRATDLLLLLHFDQQMGGRLLAMHGFLSKSKDRLAHHLLTLFELRRIRASLQLRSDAALTLELVTKLELFSFHCTMDCDQHLHADSPAWFVRKIAEQHRYAVFSLATITDSVRCSDDPLLDEVFGKRWGKPSLAVADIAIDCIYHTFHFHHYGQLRLLVELIACGKVDLDALDAHPFARYVAQLVLADRGQLANAPDIAVLKHERQRGEKVPTEVHSRGHSADQK